MEIYTPFIGLFTTLLGAAIGYYLKYFLDKKKELTSEVTKERRIMYQQFIDLILNIFYAEKNKTTDMQTNVNGLQEFFKKNILYASPKVIKATSILFQHFYNNEGKNVGPKSTLGYVTLVIKEMRNDLGLSNKGLGKKGEELIKPMFKGWDKFME